MQRNYNAYGRRKITQQSAEKLAPAWAGYDEVKRGIPFNPDKYKCRIDQGNYELGRLRAVNILASGQGMPTWNEGKKLPHRVKAAILYAAEKVGPATSMARMYNP